MRCTNCDAKVPRGLTSCPNCGVYALDGPPPPRREERRRGGRSWPAVLAALLLAGAAAGAWWWLRAPTPAPRPRSDTAPVHVVRDRPGGNVDEAEAIRVLRRFLAARGTKSECLAVISHGRKGDAYELTAVDSCARTKLGTWRVPRGGQAPSPVLH